MTATVDAALAAALANVPPLPDGDPCQCAGCYERRHADAERRTWRELDDGPPHRRAPAAGLGGPLRRLRPGPRLLRQLLPVRHRPAQEGGMSAETAIAPYWRLIPDDGQPDSASVCGYCDEDDNICEENGAYSVWLEDMFRDCGGWPVALCVGHTAEVRTWPRVLQVQTVRPVGVLATWCSR